MPRLLAVWIALASAGCFETDRSCVGSSAEEGCDDRVAGSPIDEDGDGIPDGVVVDVDPGLPVGDADEDGTPNDTDTDDDDDGIPDDVDVDVDGDGVVEEEPSGEVLEATWSTAVGSCHAATECCAGVVEIDGAPRARAACEVTLFRRLVAELAQAAATAGAAVDEDRWHAEWDYDTPAELRWDDSCPSIDRGHVLRLSTLEDRALPYFHGTRAIGESCRTRWDCEADGRCEGLSADGSSTEGTCGVRPRRDGPCGASEPTCPAGTVCTVTEGEGRCERPRDENEFCVVFEHLGQVHDNCNVDTWCDDTLETAACRPLLRDGDPCDDARQCLAFECEAPDATCPSFDTTQADEENRTAAASWCMSRLPTAQPLP